MRIVAFITAPAVIDRILTHLRRHAPPAAPGGIRWHAHRVPVSHTLIEEDIGFEAIDDGLWDVYFFHCRLGRFDERVHRIVDDRGRTFRHQRRV